MDIKSQQRDRQQGGLCPSSTFLLFVVVPLSLHRRPLAIEGILIAFCRARNKLGRCSAHSRSPAGRMNDGMERNWKLGLFETKK